MSVNNVGPNVAPSSLLTSYLANGGASAAQTASAIQTAPAPQTAPLQTLPAQTPAQSSALTNSVQLPPVQLSASQAPLLQPQAPVMPVSQTQTEPADLKKPEADTKKFGFIDKAKELFKNPKAKKIAAGIAAAVVIAGIVIFALCSRKKPEVSPELESALQDFVDTIGSIINPR